MDLLASLLGDQNGPIVSQLGRQFGLDDRQAASALGALMPALAAGLKNQATSPGGLEALLGALGSGGHARYLDDLGSLARPETVADGNGILGHVFGSKDVSRQVAQHAAAQSGVGADLLKKMLPVAAAMLMGAMAKRQFGGVPQSGPSLGSMTGGGGLLDSLSSMLDRDRDGSMADDVVGMLGKFMGGR